MRVRPRRKNFRDVRIDTQLMRGESGSAVPASALQQVFERVGTPHPGRWVARRRSVAVTLQRTAEFFRGREQITVDDDIVLRQQIQ